MAKDIPEQMKIDILTLASYKVNFKAKKSIIKDKRGYDIIFKVVIHHILKLDVLKNKTSKSTSKN